MLFRLSETYDKGKRREQGRGDGVVSLRLYCHHRAPQRRKIDPAQSITGREGRHRNSQATDNPQSDYGDSDQPEIADRLHRYPRYSSSSLLDEPSHGGGGFADTSRSGWRVLAARLTRADRTRRGKDRGEPGQAQDSEFNSAQQDRSCRQRQIAAADAALLGAFAH